MVLFRSGFGRIGVFLLLCWAGILVTTLMGAYVRWEQATQHVVLWPSAWRNFSVEVSPEPYEGALVALEITNRTGDDATFWLLRGLASCDVPIKTGQIMAGQVAVVVVRDDVVWEPSLSQPVLLLHLEGVGHSLRTWIRVTGNHAAGESFAPVRSVFTTAPCWQ